ncbi:hypothetical protein UPYG_G00096200 [Umbra pygmaea]|uniref:NACHT domain-containing protein n=1 Tax=Umbra pygmaea TaxID=75934 RepID=A0ABD0XFT6_UMBPY
MSKQREMRGEEGTASKMSHFGENYFIFTLTFFIILIYIIYKTMMKRRQDEEYLINDPASKMSHSGEIMDTDPASKMSLSGEIMDTDPASKMSHSGEIMDTDPASKMSHSGEIMDTDPASKMSHSGEIMDTDPASKMSLSGEIMDTDPASKMSHSGEIMDTDPASKMSHSGEIMDTDPASKMSHSGHKENKDNSLIYQERPASPVPSCVSMKSDLSMEIPIHFREGDVSTKRSPIHQERPASSVPSCVSMKSDRSMEIPIHFREGDISTKRSSRHLAAYKGQNPEDEKLKSSAKHEALLDEGHKDRRSKMKNHNVSQSTVLQAFMTLISSFLFNNSRKLSLIRQHKSDLKKKFQCVFEGLAKQGNPTLLNKIYTELYITEGGSGEVNNEHEVRQIETTTRKQARPETAIKCNDIFKPLPGQDKPIRTVLTKGVAGIGKTVSVQKFILDWAEGKANQDIQFIFSLRFRELNLLKREKSLIELLNYFLPETKGFSNYNQCNVLFIFDGLDECRLPLDFKNNECVCDVTESTSVDVLLTNLIKGNLLPSALIWITTRPAAANQIPPGCVDQVTEVRGFNDPQKEEYFRKRFSDQDLARRIILHIKTSRSLYIMCHIPVFCWISAVVLEHMLTHTREELPKTQVELPKTLTDMYAHFLIFQSTHSNVKYGGKNETGPHWKKQMIMSLGKLAFQQLQKGNLIFYEEDLKECGLDINEASVYSGVCTQIFKEESGLYQNKVYSFVHLSIQEFLAALYVFLSFNNNNEYVLPYDEDQKSYLKYTFSDDEDIMSDLQYTSGLEDVDLMTGEPDINSYRYQVFILHQSAVKNALQSKTGHLDLFLRFLLGLSLESNQKHLQGLLTKTRSSSQSHEETDNYQSQKSKSKLFIRPMHRMTLHHPLQRNSCDSYATRVLTKTRISSQSHKQTVKYIKKKIRENPSSERCINLFHCLNELNDNSLVEEIQTYLRSGLIFKKQLSPSQWSALVFMLLTSKEEIDVFDLRKYSSLEDGLLGMLPVIKTCSTVILSDCRITEKGCASLVSALEPDPSHLKELDLRNNDLKESGMQSVCSLVKNLQCKLETLRLSGCGVTEEGCASLVSALRSNPSYLKELDLCSNDLEDSGVKMLSATLEDPQCRLEILRLSGCLVKEEGCASLASALKSNPYMRELDLSNNDLKDAGVKLLSAGLEDPECKLETLKLSFCGVTEEGCSHLASVLKLNSHLKELDLSNNDLKDAGVKLLSTGLEDPECKLETLRLSGCLVTEEGCASLVSALRLNPSHLKELDLSYNHPGDSGVTLLSAGLEDPTWRLEKINMEHGGEFRLKSGLKKYACYLTLDPNTAFYKLSLSEDCRKVTHEGSNPSFHYPDHPDRNMSYGQLLCREGLSVRSYWEVETNEGRFDIALAYKGISRTEHGKGCDLGMDGKSWGLQFSGENRLGLYLDSAGTLSYYRVSNDKLTHAYTFNTTFTEPLYPIFRLWTDFTSVSLV